MTTRLTLFGGRIEQDLPGDIAELLAEYIPEYVAMRNRTGRPLTNPTAVGREIVRRCLDAYQTGHWYEERKERRDQLDKWRAISVSISAQAPIRSDRATVGWIFRDGQLVHVGNEGGSF